MTTRGSASRRSSGLPPIAGAHLANKDYVDSRGAVLLDGDGEPYYSAGQVAPNMGLPLGIRYSGLGATKDTFRPGVLSNISISASAPAFAGQRQITHDDAVAGGMMRARGGILRPKPDIAAVMVNTAANTAGHTSYDLSTRLLGSKISAHLFFTEDTNVQIWINNQKLSRMPVASPGMNSQFVTLEFGERDVYDIDISMSRAGGFVQWLIPGDATLIEPPVRDKWFWIGDSYGTGAYGTAAYPGNNFLSVAPYWFFKYMGVDGFNMAAGGTGYLNDSGPSGTADGHGTFGGAARKAALARLPADMTAGVFFGSANDAQGQWSAAQIKAAAKATYAMVAQDRPGLPLIVFGTQSGTYPAAGIDTNLLNAANAAIKEACDESPNVRKFIDMRAAKGLMTGTGYIGGATGDGNQDFLVSNDKIHASPEGFHHVGLWCAEQVKRVTL